MTVELYKARLVKLEQENLELRKKNRLLRNALIKISSLPVPDPIKMMRRVATDLLHSVEKVDDQN